MAIFTGELGLQFVTHLANHYTIPELIRLARLGADKGFSRIWFNDNIRYRSQLVVMTAVAAHVPIPLGTAGLASSFFNPLTFPPAPPPRFLIRRKEENNVVHAPRGLRPTPQHNPTTKKH